MLIFIYILANFLNLISNEFHKINSIEAVIPSTGHIVTSLDILQRGFDGSNLSKEEIIIEHLLEIYGKDVFAMDVDDETIKRYLEKMGFKQSQLEYMADTWLFKDVQEFYDLFKRVHGSGGTMQQLIESLVTVTEEFLKNIYDETPLWREPAIYIETASVPLNDKRKEKAIRDNILKCDYHKIKNIKWDAPTWINESELSDQVLFLKSMNAGDIVSRDFGNEFVLYKVIQKRDKELIPLSERRSDLIKIAREKKYTKAREEALETVKSRYVVAEPKHTENWIAAETDPTVVKPS